MELCMNNKELINIKTMTSAQIMERTGQDSGSSISSGPPKLSINRTADDDDGNLLPLGSYMVYVADIGEYLYGKPVTLRPFICAMQYMEWDSEEKKYSNRSIIFKNWKEEAIDANGGTRCGKLPQKSRTDLTPQETAEQKNKRCYRLVYGLLTMNGVKANKEKHRIENFPVLFRVQGTSFAPVNMAVETITRRKKLMHNCSFTLTSKKQTQGGNFWYTPDIKVNTDVNLELDKQSIETFEVFEKIIEEENKEVFEEYKQARSKKPSEQDIIDAKIVNKIEEDNETSPEKMLSN